MRVIYSVVFVLLILALGVCAYAAGRSRKAFCKPVMLMLLSLIPPIIGNLILLISTRRVFSSVGCYIYYLGMDFVMLALLRFTGAYCYIAWKRGVRILIYVLLGLDAVQLLLNPFFSHAFAFEGIMAYDALYFRMVPYLGQAFHRVVDYGIVAAMLVIFTVKLIRSPRIDSERYSVILICMVFTTVWETLYIFSRTPVDRSMIGFGVFGLLVFYFSLYYRPLRLLDSMLATVASEMPEALFFFDGNSRCIWANRRGTELTQVESGGYEAAGERLGTLMGTLGREKENWSDTRAVGSGENVKSYVLEHRTLKDDKGRDIGAFLSVRDNTAEQKTLQREVFNATHDALTRLYNRAGYDMLVADLDVGSVTLLLLDADKFKPVNDLNGHEVGDLVLKKIAFTMRRFFRAEDYLCRVGGDEFVILMRQSDPSQEGRIRERIRCINDMLRDTQDGLPPISVSVGVAFGEKDLPYLELFNRADRALYETKHRGGCSITFYHQNEC